MPITMAKQIRLAGVLAATAAVASAGPATAAWHWVYVGNSDCAVPDLHVMPGSTSPSSFEMARMCSQNFHPYPGNAAICFNFGYQNALANRRPERPFAP